MGTAHRDPNVYCNACGAVVTPDLPDGTRVPCAECGSVEQLVKVTIEDTVSFKSELRLAVRHGEPGEVAPHLEHRQGDSWSKKLGKWLYRTMRIDREADLYEEAVRDPESGEMIHRNVERLSEHRGHGDDRERPA